MTDFQISSNLIPAATLTRWQTRARRGALSTLKSLLEFRELVPDFRAEAVLMQAYQDAAKAMMIATDTLRDLMGKIREYPEGQLIFWINNGVSFDHMEKANQLAEIAHKTPAALLNEAVNPGNATGETMTVRELTAYALGEVAQPMKAITYRRVTLWNSLGKFPTTGWDDDKVSRFAEWREAGREFIE